MAPMARLRLCTLASFLTVGSAAIAIPGFKTTYEVVAAGVGSDKVTAGSTVTVHATGVVAQTSKKFWSTKDKGQQPFTYKAGVGGVITGWDQGCLGMKLGEVRQLNIPAAEAYGEKGFAAWGIPPNGVLHFSIEVLKIEGGKTELR
jgi:FKBP-type peptidyl-prolyl cis-trans isomerase